MITILGSTGTIGKNTLSVLQSSDKKREVFVLDVQPKRAIGRNGQAIQNRGLDEEKRQTCVQHFGNH